jgi:hypothetical protein
MRGMMPGASVAAAAMAVGGALARQAPGNTNSRHELDLPKSVSAVTGGNKGDGNRDLCF